ncbi:MAG: putative acylphosphatase [Phenylobacterium sp.]|nr:putative acylphosphatase [Phenylobacterium sp.]
MSTITVRLVVEGQVQGVGFRAWMVRRATALGVAGWVRNCSDGSVEALASGDIAAVEAFVAACGVGPEGARVRAVRRSPAQDDGSRGFRQKATL